MSKQFKDDLGYDLPANFTEIFTFVLRFRFRKHLEPKWSLPPGCICGSQLRRRRGLKTQYTAFGSQERE